MIFTIGHSTHQPEVFVDLLNSHDVGTVLDIRSHPTSKWPWFHKDDMRQWLAYESIKYEWWPSLGGWDVQHAETPYLVKKMAEHGVDLNAYSGGKFPKQRIGISRNVESDSPAWTNQGLYDYSWFTTLPEFMVGLDKLADRSDNCAIMCAEALWWKCHRSMVADVMWYRHDWSLYHIMGASKVTDHQLVLGNRIDRYEDEIKAVWDK